MMDEVVAVRPLLLIVLDGFGTRASAEGNAVAAAKMPFYHSLLKAPSYCLLDASGEAVGLPAGTMGNSEVGHFIIGAGRVIYQDYSRINRTIADGSFFKNRPLLELVSRTKQRKATLHLIGLLSDAGVHAHLSHLLALIELAKRQNVATRIHLITDGRDMDPHSSSRLVALVESTVKSAPSVSIATVGGRYYAMDRDKRWNRTRKSYRAIVQGEGLHASSAAAAVQEAYARKDSDEFVTPTVIGDYGGFGQHDSVFFFNFRADRARQLCWSFTQKNFRHFATAKKPVDLATMTSYDAALDVPVAFPSPHPDNGMSEVVSRHGLRQLHIAETEKYAHVTYFFNGGQELQFPGEERILIPSKKVSTYDLQPGMSAEQITNAVLQNLDKGYSFVLVNFANPDMVAHTGNFAATVRALAIIDRCLRRIITAARENYVVVVTADHGNCEEMSGALTTAHTTNRVPFIMAGNEPLRFSNGGLSGIAPTLLALMHIPKPEEMTGRSLLSGTARSTENFK